MRETINESTLYRKIQALEALVSSLEERIKTLEGGASSSQTRLDAVLSQADSN